MIPGFAAVLAASEQDRRDLFAAAARQIGTAEQNIEKDFWVCWALDALFNQLGPDRPRLLFKGGTSLSKGYGLIDRFSEDIDVTVFREDIGQAASVEELEALSGKKRRARLDGIKAACQVYVAGEMRDRLGRVLERNLEESGIAKGRARIEIDADDPDRQSLLIWYPAVTADMASGYIRPAVKIESGAKSALDPHQPVVIRPYVADELPDIDLSVPNVTTVDPERTFWDKAIILHGLRRWFERRGTLRGGGQRVSRHYYDIHRLLGSAVGDQALVDMFLAADCVRHARMFFNSNDLDLATAEPGMFAITPIDPMIGPLRHDYEAMSGMIFGDVPTFDTVIESVTRLEDMLNRVTAGRR